MVLTGFGSLLVNYTRIRKEEVSRLTLTERICVSLRPENVCMKVCSLLLDPFSALSQFCSLRQGQVSQQTWTQTGKK